MDGRKTKGQGLEVRQCDLGCLSLSVGFVRLDNSFVVCGANSMNDKKVRNVGNKKRLRCEETSSGY